MVSVEGPPGRGNSVGKDRGVKACGMFQVGPGPVCMSESGQRGDQSSEWVDYGGYCLPCCWIRVLYQSPLPVEGENEGGQVLARGGQRCMEPKRYLKFCVTNSPKRKS